MLFNFNAGNGKVCVSYKFSAREKTLEMPESVQQSGFVVCSDEHTSVCMY